VRGGAIACLSWIFWLSGCGYVGPVLPPSPQLPQAITDLQAIERGDQIVITFSTPVRTTDNLAIKQFSEIDLRIGSASIPFDFDQWAATATQYSLTPPPPNDPDDPQPSPLKKTVPVSDWLNKRVAVAVRTAVKKTDHYSPWSNRVVLEVMTPLRPPQAKAIATADGVLLTWEPQGAEMEYRVYRQGPGDQAPVQIGTSKSTDYLDTATQYETAYTYTVVATKGSAESLTSKPIAIKPVDKFPPSVPASITALGGPESIEISWQRSPEPDLKGYYLYRSVNGGPFERIADLLTLPTYSDQKVEHGQTYRYEVSAIDQKGNESAKSAPAEAVF
jgi:hypothetical protein